MNARADVALVGPDGELRDDLALGEDRAGRADADLLGGLVSEVAEVLDPDLQHAGHDVEEAPRTGGALVVHDEILHHAVLDLDDLHVLPADVHDRVHIGEEIGRALGVTAQLAHLQIGKAVERIASVAGGEDEIHLLARHFGVIQHLRDGAGGAGRAGADRDEGLGDDLLTVLHDHAFRRGGPHVDAHGVNAHNRLKLHTSPRGESRAGINRFKKSYAFWFRLS